MLICWNAEGIHGQRKLGTPAIDRHTWTAMVTVKIYNAGLDRFGATHFLSLAALFWVATHTLGTTGVRCDQTEKNNCRKGFKLQHYLWQRFHVMVVAVKLSRTKFRLLKLWGKICLIKTIVMIELDRNALLYIAVVSGGMAKAVLFCTVPPKDERIYLHYCVDCSLLWCKSVYVNEYIFWLLSHYIRLLYTSGSQPFRWRENQIPKTKMKTKFRLIRLC